MTEYRRNSGSRSGRRSAPGGRQSRDRLSAVKSARSSGSRRGGNHRKKNGPDITKILMYGIAAVILLIVIFLVVKMAGSRPASGDTTSEPETELEKEVTVDGVVITGMLREEAMETIVDHIDWGMKVVYDDKEAEVPNLMEAKVDELLEEIYHGEPKETYELDTDGLSEAITAAVDTIADGWDVKPRNGGISEFDSESGSFKFAEGTVGIVIDREKMAADIESALKEKNYRADIQASASEQQPEMTAAQAKEMYKTIGTYTTKTTSNKDRNENIRLASNALNGKILNPGEEFSFNDTTGARTTEKGYKPAGAYVNGVLVEEPGGGVCQVSSTLYNAVIFSGLKTTERHAHSYEPSYVTPGEDAMVSYGGPDMKFTNTSEFPIAIRASFYNQELTISIYGVPILEEGVKVRMHSEKVSDIDPPPPVYEEDQTLQPGVEVVAKEPTLGSRWTTNLVITKDGTVVSDEVFHNSSYRGKAATIKRNTSGTVVLPEGESGASLSSDESSVLDPNAPTDENASQGSAEGPGNNTPVSPGTGAEPGGSPAGPSQDSPSPGSPGGSTGPVSPGGQTSPTAPSAETPSVITPIGEKPTQESTAAPIGPGM